MKNSKNKSNKNKTNKNKTNKNKTNKNKTNKKVVKFSSTTKNKKNKIYKKTDYNSGDGMMTSVWGPSMWHVLHTMSFNYPIEPTKEQRQKYRDFVLSLKWTLPCKYCRINLKNNFRVLPLTMDCMKNRDTFSRYIYRLHELVNKMLKKKSGLTYCDVRERYEHFRSRCNNTETNKRIIDMSKTLKNGKGKHKKESGCVNPLYGKKTKCILKIVPKTLKCKTFQVNH